MTGAGQVLSRLRLTAAVARRVWRGESVMYHLNVTGVGLDVPHPMLIADCDISLAPVAIEVVQ